MGMTKSLHWDIKKNVILDVNTAIMQKSILTKNQIHIWKVK